jgi:hypothetical protein
MRTVTVCVTALLGLVCGIAASAKPEYAQKEAKACQYCHMSASPGLIVIDPETKERHVEPFTRNNRGLYYADHNHSFDGYVERKVMGAGAPPVFHFGWRETLLDAPRRVAVADVMGDGKSRFITLNDKPGDKTAAVLTVKHWGGKGFVTDFTAETPGPSDRLEVGRYAGADRPAVILTTQALWYWNGKTFVHLAAAQPLTLFGSTRLRDGSERVLIANSPTDVKAYEVDLKAQGADWLKNGVDTPGSNQVSWGDMHATGEVFDKIGIPTVLGQGGVIGLWDVRKFGKTFLYHARINQDFEVKTDPANKGKPQFEMKNQTWCVEFVDPNETGQSNARKSGPVALYFTPTLIGAIYDIATESAKGDGAPGLLILTSDSADGKGRSLYFFPLD